jgi:hypothetical protein
MPLPERDYSHPHPLAPKELEQFAFLIGRWRCESRVLQADESFATYHASRVGRYVLDGWVIADEFRQVTSTGELMQLGENYRMYDRVRGLWMMKWLDALTSTWLDLGPESLGGVRVSDALITYEHARPPGLPEGRFPSHTKFRNSFSNISHDHFTWRAEISGDGGDLWRDVQVIESFRVEEP